ncbi:hypothetical protein CDAR_225031 [Caerostris darwini]|uniref:Uncharacterized protein n=1 Tax=Caerostris darwini TaxID=1538125 RepID=A0AAV4T8M6_9ARAC|nr:hypothetical protein CDAR_225031 [Caerostris darwini]
MSLFLNNRFCFKWGINKPFKVSRHAPRSKNGTIERFPSTHQMTEGPVETQLHPPRLLVKVGNRRWCITHQRFVLRIKYSDGCPVPTNTPGFDLLRNYFYFGTPNKGHDRIFPGRNKKLSMITQNP